MHGDRCCARIEPQWFLAVVTAVWIVQVILVTSPNPRLIINVSRVIGTTHDMHSVITGIFLPSLTCREYTLMEKVNLWRSKSRFGVSFLWDKMLTTDLAKEVPELDLPVYFYHGVFDYTCSYTQAKSYFVRLKAPLKGFYTFEQSAHSPIFEEPEKMRRILLEDVLVGANNLADVK